MKRPLDCRAIVPGFVPDLNLENKTFEMHAFIFHIMQKKKKQYHSVEADDHDYYNMADFKNSDINLSLYKFVALFPELRRDHSCGYFSRKVLYEHFVQEV